MAKYLCDRGVGEGRPKKTGAFMMEKAVGFFLENHMLGEMVKADGLIKNCPVLKRVRADYVAGDTCIEVKVLERCKKMIGEDRSAPAQSVLRSIASFERGRGNLEALQEHFERVILLIVCEEGALERTGMVSLGEELKRGFKESMDNGLEIWISEVKLEEDGITLLSYQNIANDIAHLGEDSRLEVK